MPKAVLGALVATVLMAVSMIPALNANANAPSSSAGGAVYHVDCSRPTNGDGLANPWNSSASVTAHGAFRPGDSILFKRGTTCVGRVRPSGSGTAGHQIVMGAYGKGSLPTLAGGGSPDLTAVVMLVNVSHWTVEDLRVTNHGRSLRTTGVYRGGVELLNQGGGRLAGMIVQRLHVQDVVSSLKRRDDVDDSRNWAGIMAITRFGSNPAASGYDHLVIRHNVVDHVGRTGIMISNATWPKGSDRNTRVAKNSVRYARSDSIVVRGSLAPRIDHNVSAHGADMWPCPECSAVNDSWHASVAIWTASSRNAVIDHNEVYGMRKMGGDGEAFDIDVTATGAVLEYNYAHENQGGGVLLCGSKNAIIRFNIFQDNNKAPFNLIGNFPAYDSEIYNNTVFSSRASRAGVVRYFNGASGAGMKFFNNIIYSYGKGFYEWPMQAWSRSNTYVGTHEPGEPHGAGYTWRDPQLIRPGAGGNGFASLNGYRPSRAKSVGTGIRIPKDVTTDFFGRRVDPGRPPRGAAG